MWPNPQFPADLVTFTEELVNGTKLQCKNNLIVCHLGYKKKP